MVKREQQARQLNVPDFLCNFCKKRKHHSELDFSQRVATCKTCTAELS